MDKIINPQAENGHVDIANTIVEEFCRFHLSGHEWQILWVVLRKTYGWHKKQDDISLSQYVLITKIPRRCVIKAIKKLVTKKVLLVTKKTLGGTNSYIFNKHFNEWIGSDQKDTGSDLLDTKGSDQKDTYKRNYTKEIKHMSVSDQKDTTSFDFELIWNKYPNKDGRKAAEKHFRNSVKTQQDYDNIQKALKNYLSSKPVQNGYIKNGSTWFYNWQDWIDNNAQKQNLTLSQRKTITL